jgi:tetratricopeptide (TPR) repeat protein
MTTPVRSGVTKREWNEAHDFFSEKLVDNPTMPKYNICMAALYGATGNNKDADFHYKTALMVDPGNIMNRSDYALHLTRIGKGTQAKHEMVKAQIITENQPTLHKNLGAIYARTGDFKAAEHHAHEAVLINPDDSMNQRNYAKMLNLRGKTKEAIKFNMKSVELDMKQGKPVASNALRSAAVQLLSKGDGVESALALVRQARNYDGVYYQSDTTIRTNEIKRQILNRKGQAQALESGDNQDERRVISDRAKNAASKYTEKLDALDNF